ncbi:glycosyltransferase [Heliobacterium gestii]|uniref:Glycosyltransferase n=1 Tax=Heliomicrobium gestii TaxID=2699 RepID=A0A845LEQ9_HELGE|nr:glycosyltransferase family 1 protein [Heliomicrobium gestii]MBM7866611.1 glycosyltransferase involved in cell wall biosynthesis [Heliomicrobium gestii]MZP43109.1 glycosyltransferase [Heliomicrobium gestii]
MKIAIDVVPIRPDGRIGGAMHLVMELIRGLAIHRELEIMLLTASWNHQFFIDSFKGYKVEHHCIECPQQMTLFDKVKRRLRQLFAGLDIDISGGIKGPLRSRGVELLFCPMTAVTYYEPGIPTVSLVYDIQHEYYPSFFSPEELTHRRAFYKVVCKKADAIICISEYTKQTIIEKFNLAKDNVYVAPICIQDRLIPPETGEQQRILQEKGLEGLRYGYYPANFWKHKNHLMLLTAFSSFIQRHPDSDLHLVFTGCLREDNPEIDDAIRQMGLQERIHFLGYLTESELTTVLHHCDFLVYPSLFEGFGIPVIEAMAVGKPVLCSNRTSLPEVGGDAAYYFDPRIPASIEEAIDRISTDETLREDLVRKGHRQAKKYPREAMINGYLQVLLQVVQQEQKDICTVDGVYVDKWTAEDVRIHFIGKPKMRTVMAELLHSGGNPAQTIAIHIKSRQVTSKRQLIAGQREEITFQVPLGDDSVHLAIFPTFCPADNGSPDTRQLGIQIVRLEVWDDKGIMETLL